MKPTTHHLATGRRRRPAQRPADPLAPLSDQYLRRQAANDVRAEVNPIVASIRKSITDQATSGSKNISGIAEALAASLAPYAGKVADIYSGTDKTLGAIDNQLADRLGAGTLANDLKARIAAAGGDTSLADSLMAASKGAAGASFAKGSADRSMLASEGAHEQSYAAGLPAIAKLGGLQGVRDREARAQQDLSTQIGNLEQNVPTLITQELSNSRNREFQKGVARIGYEGDVYKANLGYQAKQTATAASNKRNAANLSEKQRHDKALEQQAQANLNEAKRGHDISIAKARSQGRRPNAALSGKYGYIVDGDGHPILDKHGKKIKVSKTSASDPLRAIYGK
jgi:hypothetical protein